MAYNKVYPTVNEDVLEYTKNQEDRIARAVDPIETGTVDGITYEKYADRTLIQRGIIEGTGNSIGKPYPIPFTARPHVLISPLYVDGVGGSAKLTYVVINSSVTAGAYIRDNGQITTTPGAYMFEARGRW